MEDRPDTVAGSSTGPSETQVMHAMSMDDVYRVERVLGRGAGGITECVTIDGAGPFVRKKVPLDQAHRTVWAALSECRCPFLPKIRATYEMPDWFVVVCDFVPGETLQQAVTRRGSLPLDEALGMAKNLCVAVEELHAHGIVHRDLSPANIVLASDGAHLIDFGLARLRLEPASTSTAPDSTPLGTWGFAAPEQYGFAGTDARSDVYSLGKLLGFALTGVRPDDGRYDALLQNDGTVPEPVRTAINRACAFEPSARFQSASEFADALAGEGAQSTGIGAIDSHPSKSEDSRSGVSTNGGEARQADLSHAPVHSQSKPIPHSARTASPHVRNHLTEHRRWVLPATFAIAIAITLIAVALILGSTMPFADPNESSPTANDSSSIGQGTALNASSTGSASDVGGSASGMSSQSSAPDLSEVTPELVESGWTYGANRFVNYAYAVRNPSDKFAVELPEITVTGRSADGAVLFSDTNVLSTIGPGQTFRFTSIAESEARPASVEFAVLKPDSYNVAESQPFSEFVVSNVSISPDDLGGITITGEATAEEGPEPPLSSGLQIVVILRDGQGNPIGGTDTYPSKPSPGESMPFEAQIFDPPDYASVDVYAQHW